MLPLLPEALLDQIKHFFEHYKDLEKGKWVKVTGFGTADEARQIVFMKRSMRPGFAGIENELLFEEKTSLLFGDAKDTMSKLLNAVKAL